MVRFALVRWGISQPLLYITLEIRRVCAMMEHFEDKGIGLKDSLGKARFLLAPTQGRSPQCDDSRNGRACNVTDMLGIKRADLVDRLGKARFLLHL